MIINNNISSLMATNALAKNEMSMNKSIQKLSSGMRINKAGRRRGSDLACCGCGIGLQLYL